MEPTLGSGDWMVCLSTRTPPTRGSIVVFPHPRNVDMWVVKRVVGLPGDEIVVDFGQVLINGDREVDRWGGDHETFPEGLWRVGERELFVLSDNRSATIDDSRAFGAVTLSGMLTVWWPRSKRNT